MVEEKQFREFREYCGEHSRCMEKFDTLDSWKGSMQVKMDGLTSSITDFKIFRAQIMTVVVIGQLVGAAGMTLILHFVGK